MLLNVTFIQFQSTYCVLITASCLIKICSLSDTAGFEIPGLPTYTASEVASHDSHEKKIWVCYKSGVYDITSFVSKHPGGDKILMAAGGSLEPFWELFAVHKSSQVWKFINFNDS